VAKSYAGIVKKGFDLAKFLLNHKKMNNKAPDDLIAIARRFTATGRKYFQA
jgi:hypothetical protein